MTESERRHLLECIAGLATVEAENENPLKTFLPLPVHRLALRPDIVLVLGGKGVGKSSFFQILANLRTSKRIAMLVTVEPKLRCLFVDAFSQTRRENLDVAVLDSIATSATDMQLRAFWMFELFRRTIEDMVRLHDDHKLEGISSDQREKLKLFSHLTTSFRASPIDKLRDIEHLQAQLVQAFDDIETDLQQQSVTLIATYDHLDRIGAFERKLRQRHVGALLGLWVSFSNRYKHIRGKIFLRDDLFEAQSRFPDAAKLRARSVSIEWDLPSLYRAVVRHLAARSEPMRQWLASIPGITLHDRGEFGFMPGEMPEEVQRAFLERMATKIIGRGVMKTYTHRWIASRLRDSKGRVAPRSILSLFGFAAQEALKRTPRTADAPLLNTQDLTSALEATSRQRVEEVREECPAVDRLENLRGMNMPIPRDVAVERLEQPGPFEDPQSDPLGGAAALDRLARFGALYVRDEHEIDVPDLYRYHFGIHRTGGGGSQTGS